MIHIWYPHLPLSGKPIYQVTIDPTPGSKYTGNWPDDEGYNSVHLQLPNVQPNVSMNITVPWDARTLNVQGVPSGVANPVSRDN